MITGDTTAIVTHNCKHYYVQNKYIHAYIHTVAIKYLVRTNLNNLMFVADWDKYQLLL